MLLDNGTPRGVAAAFVGHAVEQARDRGWDTFKNGELLTAAEAAGFEVFITTDSESSTSTESRRSEDRDRRAGQGALEAHQAALGGERRTVAAATPGSVIEVDIPIA